MSSRFNHWNSLRRLYEFESSLVSGPGSYRKDINDVLWSFEELQSALSLTQNEAVSFNDLVQKLLKEGNLMKVSFPDRPPKYVTRVAETVRLLGHNYEYWYRGRQSIDSVRWLIEEKKIPKRDIHAEEFIEKLQRLVDTEIGDIPCASNLKSAILSVMKGISTYFSPKDWKSARFSEFQLKSAGEMLLSQYKPGYSKNAQILTAGVGSGKTIAFSIAVLVSAVEGILSGENERRCHLFLYPRKALAQDQYRKLKDIASKIDVLELKVHFEHYSFYSSENLTVKDGIETIYGGFAPAPDLIITTLETLNRRLQHPLVIKKIAESLKRVILDEIHLVEGIPGSNIIRLLDRLRQACPREILWTGSSATVASPDLHAKKVFGLNQRSQVSIIEPGEENLLAVGMVHHVFIRPSGQLSLLGTLVNTTSVLIHNRRNELFIRDKPNYPKTIGFADSLDLLGRWNSDFRENERTENTRERPHADQEKLETWTQKQREIPYALRFHMPFQRRIDAVGGDSESEPYESVLEDLEESQRKDICVNCKKGERKSFKTCNRDELNRLGQLVYRYPHKKKDKVKIFYLHNKEVFDADSAEVGTLDLCPFLRAGACFWFSKDDFETEPIITKPSMKFEWRSVARSKIYSAKTKPKVELDDDLSELVFKATIDEVYDLRQETDIPIDVVLASPSLEVGVDLPNVTDGVMFKAIRNVASYRQKVGRIGREENSDVLNINLLSLRPIDLHYYRQPRKLTSLARLDPIPLKEHNESILRCAVYMGVWDYLALHSNLPEVVPLSCNQGGETEFTRRLKFSKDYLEKHRSNIASYLSGITRKAYSPDNPLIQEAIAQVSDEINVFLTPTQGTIQDNQVSCIADIIVHSLNRHSARIRAPDQSRNLRLVQDGETFYKRYRPAINPILFGLSEEFCKLDCFSDSGWINLERLRQIQSRIVKKIAAAPSSWDSESLDVLKRLNERGLADIVAGLERMYASGEDPVVIYFWQQFDKFKHEHQFWPYYLSYTVQGMPIFNVFRRHPSYTRPPNLFTNPYEETVALYVRGEVENNVPLSEAMFGFVPGTWTFRLGKHPRKALIGTLDASKGGVLTASLRRMIASGNELYKIKSDVPAPPGFPADSLSIYSPKKIALTNVYGKYVILNEARGTIFDGDEDSGGNIDTLSSADSQDEDKHSSHMTKIPLSHFARWVYIVAVESEPIKVNETDENYLVIEEKIPVKGSEARGKILHPMINRLVNKVNWHRNLEVYDYVYSVSRVYSSKAVNSVTIMFRDDQEGDFGIGRYFLTEGVSIELSPEAVEECISKIRDEMLRYENKWAPSIVNAYISRFSQLTLSDGTPISSFMINDLFGTLITSISADFNSETIYKLSENMEDLIKDEQRFKEAAAKFYKGRYLENVNEEDSWFSEFSKQEKQDIGRKVNQLFVFASQLPSLEVDLKETIENWIVHTLLNTFGISALSAMQRLCGSNDEEIGYTVDLEGIRDKRYRIFLYDKTQNGNGSSDVLRRYLHILNIQRHGHNDESRLLPSEDYFTLLEQELLQCPQFHTDMDALERYAQKEDKKQPVGLPELGYVGEFSDEVLRVCEKTWKKLGIRGREDAWKLPIIALSPGSFAQMRGIEVDDVIRSSAVCWNGCPECVVNTAFMIGASGRSFVDKAILDEWFKVGRAKAQEYKVIEVEDLKIGKAGVDIGRQSKVCLELPDRKIRSISLPFTIGFDLDRKGTLGKAQLLIRDDDIQDFRIFEKDAGTSAHGIGSLGFRRIMWYTLLTSAYLDVLEQLEENRKEIRFVFYDCSDLTFDDIGISPRIVEAIEYHRRKEGIKGNLNNLSDILIWLAKRNFKIHICVDEKRSKEVRIANFLKKLAKVETDNISIKMKRLPGLMHKKALISPVGVIQGSANLTFSGACLNEEIINFAPYGVPEYDQMKVNIIDTFHGSKEWNPEN